jgi:hypothetical protein
LIADKVGVVNIKVGTDVGVSVTVGSWAETLCGVYAGDGGNIE